MKEILFTSSVLIAALLLLRFLFRRTISRQTQYALWFVVLLRLLLPVSITDSAISVLRLAEGAQTQFNHYAQISPAPNPVVNKPNTATSPPAITPQETKAVSPVQNTPSPVLPFTAIWLIGAVLCALCFLFSNLRFAGHLRRTRVTFHETDSRLPLYTCKLPSPCLFGFLRPAIYLNDAALRSEVSLRHVLAHEESHYQQGDHIWSVLRALCLAIYWFHPLVWVAAYVSRTDCELACDERALRHLSETDRLPYGHTLLSLIPLRGQGSNPLLTATTMQGNKRQLRERISRIANQRRPVGMAIFLALALVALFCVMTFTGSHTKITFLEPSGEAEFVISMQDLEPYTAPTLTVTRLPIEDSAEEKESALENEGALVDRANGLPVKIFLYRAKDGSIGAAYRMPESSHSDFYRFARFPADYSVSIEVDESPSLGQKNSFSISYAREVSYQKGLVFGTHRIPPDRTDYYYFDQEGNLKQLIASGRIRMGFSSDDGSSGFLSEYEGEVSPALWYGNKGQIYRTEIRTLLQSLYPNWFEIHLETPEQDFRAFSPQTPKSASLYTFYWPVSAYDTETGRQVKRFLWVKNGTIAIYPDTRASKDHVVATLSSMDKDVLDSARSFVKEQFSIAQATYPELKLSDWRVESLDSNIDFSTASFGDSNPSIRVFCLNYEFLCGSPENFTPVGGSYLTDDNWCMLGYPESNYLVYQVAFPDIPEPLPDTYQYDPSYQYLGQYWTNDMGPGSDEFSNAIYDIVDQAIADGRIETPPDYWRPFF